MECRPNSGLGWPIEVVKGIVEFEQPATELNGNGFSTNDALQSFPRKSGFEQQLPGRRRGVNNRNPRAS